ncbi:MAG: anti-sigma factor antagonist [Clostridia bacterium]|nr:anti-sigma factor antagonist [Clostridia bacterium]
MITYETKERLLTVEIAGEIDHHTAAGLRAEIDEVIKKYSPLCLTLDFSQVNFCDSSGIALVLGRYRLMKSLGGDVELTGLAENVSHIFEMADLKKIVTIR